MLALPAPPHGGKRIGMTRRLIASGSPYEARFGYSRAVVDGDWCFVAGTTGRDPASGLMPDDVRQQAINAFATITAALTEGGFAMTDVVRATYYVTDAAYQDVIAPILAQHFGTIRPAATLIVAGLIEPAMKIEIEVTAKRADT